MQELANWSWWKIIEACSCGTLFPLNPILPKTNKPTGNDAILLNFTYGLRTSSFQFLHDYGSLSVYGPFSSTEVSCVLKPISVMITAALLLSSSPASSKLQEGSCGVLVLPALRNCFQ